MNYKIDNLQYCNWSREVFEINHEAGLDAVHVTVVYHEDYKEFVKKVEEWNVLFKENEDLIFLGKNFKDIEKAKIKNKTAIFFGFQNCSPIEDDISLVEKIYEHGCRFMQLTYNNQSLLATGCYEKNDSGVTNFGREVIKEMNRLGIVIDMSHSAEKSTYDAIEISQKPIAITHANPIFWHKAVRNKSDELLKALSESGGMFSLILAAGMISLRSAIIKTDEVIGSGKILKIVNYGLLAAGLLHLSFPFLTSLGDGFEALGFLGWIGGWLIIVLLGVGILRTRE